MITKVKSVHGNGTYDSKHGLLYKFEYTFDDGVSLVANHKSQVCPFKIGDTVEYNINGTNTYGSWGNVGKPKDETTFHPDEPKNGKGHDREKSIVLQNSFTQAIGYYNMVGFKNSSKSELDQLCETAKYIADYNLKYSAQ